MVGVCLSEGFVELLDMLFLGSGQHEGGFISRGDVSERILFRSLELRLQVGQTETGLK